MRRPKSRFATHLKSQAAEDRQVATQYAVKALEQRVEETDFSVDLPTAAERGFSSPTLMAARRLGKRSFSSQRPAQPNLDSDDISVSSYYSTYTTRSSRSTSRHRNRKRRGAGDSQSVCSNTAELEVLKKIELSTSVSLKPRHTKKFKQIKQDMLLKEAHKRKQACMAELEVLAAELGAKSSSDKSPSSEDDEVAKEARQKKDALLKELKSLAAEFHLNGLSDEIKQKARQNKDACMKELQSLAREFDMECCSGVKSGSSSEQVHFLSNSDADKRSRPAMEIQTGRESHLANAAAPQSRLCFSIEIFCFIDSLCGVPTVAPEEQRQIWPEVDLALEGEQPTESIESIDDITRKKKIEVEEEARNEIEQDTREVENQLDEEARKNESTLNAAALVLQTAVKSNLDDDHKKKQDAAQIVGSWWRRCRAIRSQQRALDRQKKEVSSIIIKSKSRQDKQVITKSKPRGNQETFSIYDEQPFLVLLLKTRRIQRWWRVCQANRRLAQKSWRGFATRIQRWWRHFQARRRMQREIVHRDSAALVIQTIYRKRWIAKQLNAAALIIQTAVRKHLRAKQRETAAGTIQSAFRQHLFKERRKSAAKTIQSAYRKHLLFKKKKKKAKEESLKNNAAPSRSRISTMQRIFARHYRYSDKVAPRSPSAGTSPRSPSAGMSPRSPNLASRAPFEKPKPAHSFNFEQDFSSKHQPEQRSSLRDSSGSSISDQSLLEQARLRHSNVRIGDIQAANAAAEEIVRQLTKAKTEPATRKSGTLEAVSEEATAAAAATTKTVTSDDDCIKYSSDESTHESSITKQVSQTQSSDLDISCDPSMDSLGSKIKELTELIEMRTALN